MENHERFENGTINYLDIPALKIGLEHIESIYAHNNDYRVDSIDIDNFDLLDKVKKIRIAGGEPMINPKVKQLLEKIKNIDVNLEIITNLSEIDFQLLSRFKNLHITGSIDHINLSIFSYIFYLYHLFSLQYKDL